MSEFEEIDDIFSCLDVPVKDYLKRLLMLSGYDELSKLENIDEAKLEELEEYLQGRFGGSPALSDRRELRKYFGGSVISADDVSHFKFNLGARETILVDIPKAIKRFKRRAGAPNKSKQNSQMYFNVNNVSFNASSIVDSSAATSSPITTTTIKREKVKRSSSPKYMFVQEEEHVEKFHVPTPKRMKKEDYAGMTPDELCKRKEENLVNACNKFMQNRFPDHYVPVQEVNMTFGEDLQITSATVVCPYCEHVRHVVRCSVDRNRPIHRVTIGNFVRHLYVRHVEKEAPAPIEVVDYPSLNLQEELEISPENGEDTIPDQEVETENGIELENENVIDDDANDDEKEEGEIEDCKNYLQVTTDGDD